MMPIEANRLVSFGLVVLIWLVQVIIYPSFADIAPERFARWHAGYTRGVTWIVMPLMLGQVALLGWLLAVHPSRWGFLAAGTVAVAWIATFALAVPAHEKLRSSGLDGGIIRKLVETNWIRTVAWTLTFLLLLAA